MYNMKETVKIQTLIDSKDEATNRLIDVFRYGLYKFITDAFQDNKHEKQPILEFQRKLFSVPSWSSKRKHKEFKSFLKGVDKRKRLSADDFQKLLENVVVLHVRTLSGHQSEFKIPNLENFWYKCLKLASKYFYEHPRELRQSDTTAHGQALDNTLRKVLYKHIPMNQLFKEDNAQARLRYNFDNDSLRYPEKDENSHQNFGNGDDSIHSDNSLRYISSEQFENEYY